MSTLTAVAPAAITGSSQDDAPPRIRLEFLDGVRGLAALFVVFHHAFQEVAGTSPGRSLNPLLRAFSFLHWGHYAVAVFIVLSGFCLMLPVLRAKEGRLRGGVLQYIKRRARRILPPYFAALALSLVLIAVTPLRNGPRSHWNDMLPAFTPGVLLSHLTLLHNLSSNWIYKINSPFWSVATEWQIYFVFAFCLLPVWRRFGMTAVVVSSFAATSLPYMLAPHFRHFVSACPWYLGLFTLGMAGAAFCAAPGGANVTSRYRQAPWGVFACLLFGAVLGLLGVWPDLEARYIDPVFGAATVCFLLYCHTSKQKSLTKERPLAIRLLESDRAIRLGAFSYSLYLVHFPLLGLMRLSLQQHGCSATAQFGVLMTVGVIFCLCVAYGFHLIFERRFMSVDPAPPVKA